VGNERVRAKKDAFDPTEDGSVGADSQGQTKDCQDGKARTAPEHPQAETEILQSGLDHGESSLVAVAFLGLLDAAETHKRIAPGISGGHAFAKVPFHGHFQMRAQLGVQVVFETLAAEECGETAEERA
jgi:hypothetical protein